jgi:NAD(P)-dependent dehydrogenase (short-subunit alcohol dehydrogenase family)
MKQNSNDIFSIANKTVVITGASRGIGEAIAIGCLGLGSNVIGVARSAKPQSRLLAKCYSQCDITDSNSFRDIVTESAKKYGKIDALVNAAAITVVSENEQTLPAFSATLSVNLEATFQCCWTTSSLMHNGGSIINIGSIAGFQGFPNNPGYVASKGGIRMLTKALAVDYGDKGIRVNTISPGYIKTNMTINSYNNERNRQARLDRMILKRWGTPKDLLGIAVFLISDASNYITGADIVVDGGWTAKGL